MSDFRDRHDIPLASAVHFYAGLLEKSAADVTEVNPDVGEGQGPPVKVRGGQSMLPGPSRPEIDPQALATEAQADEVAKERIIQVLDERLGQATGALQAAEQQASQSQQELTQLQEQAAQAQEQLQMQIQQEQMAKEQATQESIAAREDAMTVRDSSVRLRQAMQAYRENLINMTMQDPTPPDLQHQPPMPMQPAAVAPPQEVGPDGMPVNPMAAQGGQPAPAGPPPGALPPQMAPQPAPQKPPVGPAGALNNKTKPKTPGVSAGAKTKTSAMNSDTTARIVGALLGAGAFAGVQGLSAKTGNDGKSFSERHAQQRLEGLREHMRQRRGGPSTADQFKEGILQHQAHIAETSRKNPQAAAILAGLTGAAGGAMLAPSIRDLSLKLVQGLAKRASVNSRYVYPR